jgi:hypothetical protein
LPVVAQADRQCIARLLVCQKFAQTSSLAHRNGMQRSLVALLPVKGSGWSLQRV